MGKNTARQRNPIRSVGRHLADKAASRPPGCRNGAQFGEAKAQKLNGDALFLPPGTGMSEELRLTTDIILLNESGLSNPGQ